MTHAEAYRQTAGRDAPDCDGQLHHVGRVHVPEAGDSAALMQCRRCGRWLGLHYGRVIYDVFPPEAAMPTRAEANRDAS